MALLTAAQARLYLPGITGTGEDTTLDTLIARVGAAIAEYLGYPPASAGASRTVESATYTLYSGRRELIEIAEEGRRLCLPVAPITAVTSIYDDPNEEYGSETLVSSSDYTICGEWNNEIRLKALSTHGAFSDPDDAPRAVRAIVVAGYSSIPEELKHAAGLAVAHNYARRAAGGGTQIDAAGVRLSFQSAILPDPVLEILAPLRPAYGWAA